jgi:hypothetical protein
MVVARNTANSSPDLAASNRIRSRQMRQPVIQPKALLFEGNIIVLLCAYTN